METAKAASPEPFRTPLRKQPAYASKTPLYAVPSNVGSRTMPDYPTLAKQGIYTLDNGIRVFAGTVDDPFYIDLGAAFDSLNFRAGSSLIGTAGVLSGVQDQDDKNNYAPDALSGMRFARYQQHPQSITYPIRDNDRTIIIEGQLLRPRLDLDFDHIGSAVINCDRQRDIPIDWYDDLMQRAAVLAPCDLGLARSPLRLLGGSLR